MTSIDLHVQLKLADEDRALLVRTCEALIRASQSSGQTVDQFAAPQIDPPPAPSALAPSAPSASDAFPPLPQEPIHVVAAFPPPSTEGGEELDADGLPWSAEVHSSSRAKTKDGRWRVRRNTGAAPVPAPQAATPVPVPPPPPPPAPQNGAAIGYLLSAVSRGEVTPEVLTAACKRRGYEGLPQIAMQPAVIAEIMAELGVSA